MSDRFIVVTGGPGSGKTTLIDALERAGYARSMEAGRGIIQDQMAVDGPALPWKDPQLYTELMLCWELRSYGLARARRGPVFFDRGMPDCLGYLRLMGIAAPAHLMRACRQFRYARRVFIAPPWPAIFHQDGERKQDLAEAVRTYDAMVATYRELDYALVELPRLPVEERMAFVLAGIRAEPSPGS